MKKLVLLACVTALFSAHAQAAEPVIGKLAPQFSATDAISGQPFSLKEQQGKLVVLEWNNMDCPFVKKHYAPGNMQRLQEAAKKDGVVWVSINSSAEGKQGFLATDADAKAALTAAKANPAAYIRDVKGEIGRAYGAKTTPHMFVIDAKGNLAYQGAIDNKATADSADIPSATNHVTAALKQLSSGKAVKLASTKPYGCSVKYGDQAAHAKH